MEVALTASLLPQIVSPAQQKDEVAWEVEQSSSPGDEFSVDDLLDFEGLTDIELEEAEHEEEQDKPELTEADNLDSLCSSSSALSLELAAPSEITLPPVDVAELEWVSQFVDETFSDFPPPCPVAIPTFNPAAPKTHPHPEPQSQPVPRKKRTATCVLSTEAVVPLKAKRSKRARAAGWVRSIPVPTPSSSSPSSSSSSSSPSSSSSCFILWESRPPPEAQKPKKKRGRKPKAQALAGAEPGYGEVGGERRCSHCGVQKTPQWRAGPEGAKTLCNACGVRFKSGRLLPEYRPACSPTFLSHAHSNSHRKVLEMRRKKAELGLVPLAPPVHSF